jgi:hypothetical protein
MHATAVQNDFKDLNFKDFIVASSYSFVRLHQPWGFSEKARSGRMSICLIVGPPAPWTAAP